MAKAGIYAGMGLAKIRHLRSPALQRCKCDYLRAHPVGPDLYTLLAISPMLLWDVVRNRAVHRAYWVWLAVCLVPTVLVHALWDTS